MIDIPVTSAPPLRRRRYGAPRPGIPPRPAPGLAAPPSLLTGAATRRRRLPPRIAHVEDAVTGDRIVHAVGGHHAEVVLHRLRAFEVHTERVTVADQIVQIAIGAIMRIGMNDAYAGAHTVISSVSGGLASRQPPFRSPAVASTQ